MDTQHQNIRDSRLGGLFIGRAEKVIIDFAQVECVHV